MIWLLMLGLCSMWWAGYDVAVGVGVQQYQVGGR